MAVISEPDKTTAKKATVSIPLDVPRDSKSTFHKNYITMTKGTGRLMLFAGDQKIEHLNDDFYGKGIHQDDANPEHLFHIASRGRVGVFAAQLGLIARYGSDFADIPYLVKLNSKTHLIKTTQTDPLSSRLWDIGDVSDLIEEGGLNIPGVGYTVYLGSEHESWMLQEAARIISDAHRAGLVTVLWMYPRGKAVIDEGDPHLIAGAAGVAAALGSDFVKVNYPKIASGSVADAFKEAVMAAGRTKVLCAGGASTGVEAFLQRLHDQIHIAGAAGNATGRNIHQKGLEEAIRFCNAIYAVTMENASVSKAMKIYSREV